MSEVVSFRVPDELMAALRRRAEERGTTVSGVVRAAMEREVGRCFCRFVAPTTTIAGGSWQIYAAPVAFTCPGCGSRLPSTLTMVAA